MSNSAFTFLSKLWVLSLGALILVVAIVLDIWLATDSIQDNTWSELIRIAALKTPSVPWICGVLMGHWFHPNDDAEAVLGMPGSIALLIWLSWLVFLAGLGLICSGIPIDPSIFVIPGMVAGWLLWPV